ncbi:unnamed protein product [Ambrosiozyma monospora]|uniref:Unnamed protein product n=1 Tax=Ambrosiozyma monospora TaxID=43982 RepID=A0ACB5UA58_AMBMO|nr:unnamed protein product [Ambrosiozyma monospora]
MEEMAVLRKAEATAGVAYGSVETGSPKMVDSETAASTGTLAADGRIAVGPVETGGTNKVGSETATSDNGRADDGTTVGLV